MRAIFSLWDIGGEFDLLKALGHNKLGKGPYDLVLNFVVLEITEGGSPGIWT